MGEDYVEELIASKGKSSAIYTKYICDHDKYPEKMFCFFEGEDYKYYRSRILQYLDINEDEIFHYDCNGKKEVLKVWEDLESENNIKKIFFIDKDFDDDIINENIFQTECYSIENYYVTDEAFKHFLSTEFDLNSNDKNYIKCVDDFIQGREKFNNIITLLNAYICYIRKRDIDLDRIKIPKSNEILNKFIKKIKVDQIEVYPPKSILEIKTYINDYRNIDEESILEISEKFERMTEKEKVYRGKFEIYFLKKFIEDLVDKIRHKQYFENYDKCVSLNINNIITYLCTYADTPDNLKTFFKNYSKNL